MRQEKSMFDLDFGKQLRTVYFLEASKTQWFFLSSLLFLILILS